MQMCRSAFNSALQTCYKRVLAWLVQPELQRSTHARQEIKQVHHSSTRELFASAPAEPTPHGDSKAPRLGACSPLFSAGEPTPHEEPPTR